MGADSYKLQVKVQEEEGRMASGVSIRESGGTMIRVPVYLHARERRIELEPAENRRNWLLTPSGARIHG